MATYTKKNQDLDVRKAVIAWMAKDMKGFEAIKNGVEKITEYRLERILEAYALGNEDKLPPIRYAPQYGEIEDGRHRLYAAWKLGRTTIKADLVYNVTENAPIVEDGSIGDADNVEFSWSFENVGSEGIIKYVTVLGLDHTGINFNEVMQDTGIIKTRKLVQRLAKAEGRKFVETSDDGIAREYASARIQNYNMYYRKG